MATMRAPVADEAAGWHDFLALKGEFEAEGLTRDDIAAEALFAARHGLDYLVKIGGCEARSDIAFLQRLGIGRIVAPMIESAFAMRKYQEMLAPGAFAHVGVTIETITAVANIDAILAAGGQLGEVTIGRTDLTASFGGSGVDSPATIDHVRTIATAARRRGLGVTMGGGVNAGTRALLRRDAELAALIDAVETRKVVIPVARFLADGVLEAAIDAELQLLDRRRAGLAPVLAAASARADSIRGRL